MGSSFSSGAGAGAAGQNDKAAQAKRRVRRFFDYPVYPEVTSSLGFEKQRRSAKDGKGSGNNSASSDGDPMASARAAARKAGVAITGGALVAAGAVMIPLPTPGGILFAGAGLGVLSTEFEGAKNVLDRGKSKLVEIIDRAEKAQQQKEEEDGKGKGKGGGRAKEGEEEQEEEEGNEIEEGKEKSEETASLKDDEKANDANPSSPRGQEVNDATASYSSAGPPTATNDSTAQIKSALRTHARKLGKSIRPLLTDDEAPRRAMDDLQTSTQRKVTEVRASTQRSVDEMKVSTRRTLGRMRSHLNEIVDTFGPPDDVGGLPGWTNPDRDRFGSEEEGGGGTAAAAATTTAATPTATPAEGKDSNLSVNGKSDAAAAAGPAEVQDAPPKGAEG